MRGSWGKNRGFGVIFRLLFKFLYLCGTWFSLILKKALIYSILMVVLFNSAGYYLLFELHKYQIKQEMKALIQSNPSNYTIVKIDNVENEKEFTWIHEKEFRYKGSMYDIVRTVKKGNTTIFICLHDTRESKLFAGLQRETRDKRFFSMWEHVVLFCFSVPALELTTFQLTELKFPVIHVFLTSPLLQPWSPPPESA